MFFSFLETPIPVFPLQTPHSTNPNVLSSVKPFPALQSQFTAPHFVAHFKALPNLSSSKNCLYVGAPPLPLPLPMLGTIQHPEPCFTQW